MVDYWSTFSTYARICARETNKEGTRIHYYHFEFDIANTMVGNMKTQTCEMFCKLKKVVIFGKIDFKSWCEKKLCARKQKDGEMHKVLEGQEVTICGEATTTIG
jgi:hypothetical protein